MKKKIELQKIVKLLSVALGILILSRVLAFTGLMFMHAYVEADGKTYTVIPYKNIPLKTVLQKNGITLGETDLISKDINKPIKTLKTVKIIRVTKEKKQINESAPFRMTWSRTYNSNLRKVELQKGVEKTSTKDVIETYHDGIFHGREVLRDRTIAKNFYRLALLDNKNKIEKIYDLSKAERMKMVATAYYPGDPLAWGDGTVTFLGQKMQRGIVAVDPKVIPLKTRLFVSGYGYGYAGDTGNLIKGNRVDLGVNNAQEELSWMFRDVVVYILEPSEKY
ncbi:MAG: 3D domain-containing protein [Endomicrobia bacterium]|nr:3D domain-containing protein [Endomicrobiia bacterium]